MKARPGIVPIRAMTRKKWDKLCKLVSEGNGYRKVARIMKGIKPLTAHDYVKLCQAGFQPEWPKPEGRIMKELLDLTASYFVSENVKNKCTRRAYTQHIIHLSQYLEKMNIPLNRIKPEHIRDMVEQYKNGNTRRVHLRLYKQIFSWALLWKKIGHDPTEMLSVEQEVKVPIKIFSDKEISEIYAACKLPIERLLVSLYLYTGLRLMEVVKIKLEHIDFERRILYVPYVKGGGHVTKPLPVTLIAEMRDYMAQTKIKCEYLIVFPETCFYIKKRGTYAGPDQVNIIMQRILDAAFANDTKRRAEVSIHTFRHTYVTLNAKNVATSISHRRAFIKHMGWSSEKMLDKYLHIDDDSEALATEHVDKTFDNKKWG